MKTISISVDEVEYANFRRAARAQNRPIAQLIREAMAEYREKLQSRTPLTQLTVLSGHQPRRALPTREELYDEMFSDADDAP